MQKQAKDKVGKQEYNVDVNIKQLQRPMDIIQNVIALCELEVNIF